MHYIALCSRLVNYLFNFYYTIKNFWMLRKKFSIRISSCMINLPKWKPQDKIEIITNEVNTYYSCFAEVSTYLRRFIKYKIEAHIWARHIYDRYFNILISNTMYTVYILRKNVKWLFKVNKWREESLLLSHLI